MVAATDQVVNALNDPSLWAIGPEANVFDEHDEVREDGSPERFDRPRLERIAANCNARDAVGQPCPMTIGHTRDGVPETQQPPIVGYWRYFRVAYDDRLQRWVIRAVPYVRRDQEQTARQYPRVSVERWPADDVLDPIAVLKVTPRRDLGQWTYERTKSGRVRYSLEHSMPDTPSPAPAPVAGPAAGAGAGTPPAGGDEYAKMKGHIQRYMQECYPQMNAMHAAYAASAAPPPPAGGPPAAPAAPPAAAPAAPPTPPPHDPTKPPSAGPPPGEVARMQHDQIAIRYAQLEEQVRVERNARRLAEAERAVVQLEAENYRIPDRAREVQHMAALSESQQAERVSEIRSCYQKNPVGGPFVPTAKTREGGGKAGPMTREQFAAAQKYQREQKAAGTKVTWEKALEHVLGTSGTA